MPELLPDLPTSIDATYPDASPGDTEHQQHHDAIHGAFAALNAAGGVLTPGDLTAGGVESVNGQTGAVVLDAADVGAQPAGDYVTSTTVETIVALTQAQYDGLGTVDPATLYIVTDV